jgi:release factor glutamine methyltransferase
LTHCPAARCLAIDLSPEALEIARQNATRHQVEQRVTFLQGDGFASVPEGDFADLIVSNPPYIPTDEIASLDPEVRDYDPRLALDGGRDGLRFYRYLAEAAGTRMRPGGRLLVELGDGQAERAADLFQRHNWIVEAVHQDYSGRERILQARWNATSAPARANPETRSP